MSEQVDLDLLRELAMKAAEAYLVAATRRVLTLVTGHEYYWRVDRARPHMARAQKTLDALVADY